MQKLISVSLNGHAEPYRLNEDAYEALARYLDGAGSGLADETDRAEVLGDLERSIGDKLTTRVGADDRVVSLADVDAVLEEIGPVGAPDDKGITEPAATPRPLGRRRLARIREGQNIAGVCTGLAAYTEVRVDWVRTIMLLLTVVTAGLFFFVYLALVFILPVVATRADWLALQESAG